MKSAKTVFLVIGVVLVTMLTLSSLRQQSLIAGTPTKAPAKIRAPLGLPPVPIPADNQPTVEKIALGRRLYYDPILPGTKPWHAPPVTTLTIALPTANRFPMDISRRPAHGIRLLCSTAPILRRNSGMAVRRAWRNKQRGRCRTRWKWRIP